MVSAATPTEATASAAFLAEINRTRVMAILRSGDGASLVEPALALFAAGFSLVEISLTTPGACAAIEQLVARKPDGAQIGAGTVLTVSDVADIAAAGAQFVVTPALADSVAESVRRGLPVAAGALTPTEVLTAHRAGASVVNIFPASLGGPGYLKALRGPLPDIPLLAVGGVGVTEATQYLRAGARGVGVGSPLVGDALAGGDLASLQDRARGYLKAAAEATR
jgi:2-dehydro-3-deoxyphosphogluconate aldolase/(4S)-4-hydroxy-2-oxoglutarate aldolase